MKHEELVDGEYQEIHGETETCEVCAEYLRAFPDGREDLEVRPGVLRTSKAG